VTSEIIRYVGDKDASSVAQVNKYFNRIVEDLRSHGKLLYPMLEFSPVNSVRLAKINNNHARRMRLESQLAGPLPSQLASCKKLKHLHLKTPYLDNNTQDNTTIMLCDLIDQLPALELLTFAGDSGKEYLFRGEKPITDLNCWLKANSSSDISVKDTIWAIDLTQKK